MPDPLTELDALTLERHHEAIERAAEAIGKWATYKLERDAYQHDDGPGPVAFDILDEALDSPPHGDPLWQRCAGLANQIAEERGLLPSGSEETRRKRKRAKPGKPNAMIDKHDAAAIYIAAHQPDANQGEIAAEFGVSRSTVSKIKRRLAWADATGGL